MVTCSPKGLWGFNSPEGVLQIPLLLQLGLQSPQKDTIMETGTAAVVAGRVVATKHPAISCK